MVGRGLAAAIAFLGLCLPGLAQELLVPGKPASLQLTDGAPVRLRIEAPTGSFLSGEITAGTAGVRADLLTADGTHLRRLSRGGTGSVPFRALAEADVMLLELGAESPGRIGVALDQVVSPDDQHPAAPEHLSPRIAALARDLAAGGDSAAFWQEIQAAGTPLIEPAGDGHSVVTFLWRGARRNVRLMGGPSTDHEWLERIGDSDVWFVSFLVPDGLRLSYRLAPDVPDVPGDARARRVALLAVAQMDPLNRNPWPAVAPDRFGQSGTVALPLAPEQPGTPPSPDADPVLDRFDFDSALLDNSRRITLSHPRDFDPADPDLVTVLVFDGERALTEMDAPLVLDTLTRAGRLPPVLAVLVPSIDSTTRSRELPGNARFADALADELLPLVAARTGVRPDPARTVLAGASYGGLAAATIAMQRPDAFGNAVAMSGSFWWAPPGADTDGTPWAAAEYTARDTLPIRFFLSAGSFEGGRNEAGSILYTSRFLRDVLRLKGYSVQWREYAAGHDFYAWRGAFTDGLIALFGR